MSNERLEKLMRKIPDGHLHTILPIMEQFDNNTQSFDQIHIRKSLKPYIPEILFVYVLISVCGIIANSWMTYAVIRHIRTSVEQHSKSLKVTYHYLLINCTNDIILKCIIILPFSLSILVSIHWTFGSAWCQTFPIVQDISFYWTSVMFVMLFYYRYKMVTHIGNEITVADVFAESWHGLPACWGGLVALSIAFLGVLPYTVYIEYIDIAQYFGRQFSGSGFCVVNLSGNIQDYIRLLFLCFYVVPIALSLSFHFRTTPILNAWAPKSSTQVLTCSLPTIGSNMRDRGSGEQTLIELQDRHSRDALYREKNLQQLLIWMFTIHSICCLPNSILRISKHLVIESEENTFTFDVLYIICVAIQFASCTLSPLCFYMIKNSEKQRMSDLLSTPESSGLPGYELNGSQSFDGNALNITEIDEETVCSAE